MRDVLRHRGPDSEGIFQDSNVTLGVRRLSIIDLAHGQQPLYNEDRSLVVIANAEIYNFVELTEDLQSRGHVFRTRSDVETILHLYEEYGTGCVQHLRGMFVFALWDSNCKQLLLARDRIGEKPLYVYESGDQLIFASELKALLSSGLVPFELDPYSIDLYFHYGYVPDPLTPLRGVRKLPAAHTLLVQTQTWATHQECYWRIDEVQPLTTDPAQTIREELDSISKIIIRSDVPVGVALSGGMDSAAVLALANRHYPGSLHAFCIGYPGAPASDERNDAVQMAESVGVPFHSIELATSEVVSSFEDLIYRTDEPIADISGSAYFAVMQLAKQHNVPVLMLGHGGDELFWGYPWVVNAVKESNQKKILLSRQLSSIVAAYFHTRLPHAWSPWGLKDWLLDLGGLRSVWKKIQTHKESPPDRLLFYDLTPDYKIASAQASSIYTSKFREMLRGTNVAALFSYPQPWEKTEVLMTRLIMETYLLGNGIAQADRLSMACSVEARLPLVDYRLVEKVIGLRKAQSDFTLPPKKWLKDALKDVLPADVLSRPKRGFEPPVREWHRAIFDRYGDFLRGGFLSEFGILNEESTLQLSDGPFPKGAVIPFSYKALVLELWCRKYSSLAVKRSKPLLTTATPSITL